MGGLRPRFPSFPVSPPWALLSLPLPVVHQDRCFAQHPLGPNGTSATLSPNGHSQPQDPENHFSSWLCSHPLPPQSVSQVRREQVRLRPNVKFPPPSAFAQHAPPPCPFPSLPHPSWKTTKHFSLITPHHLASWCRPPKGDGEPSLPGRPILEMKAPIPGRPPVTGTVFFCKDTRLSPRLPPYPVPPLPCPHCGPGPSSGSNHSPTAFTMGSWEQGQPFRAAVPAGRGKR